MRTTGVWSPCWLSATTSAHQPNMVYSTATRPIRNIQGAEPSIQSTAPKSITKAPTAPRKGQIEGLRMW